MSQATHTPPLTAPEHMQVAEKTERVFGASLVFSGIRCILQYVVLPFILPAFGIAANASFGISLVLEVVAIAAILLSVRRFWKIDYKYKMQYTFVAVFALLILGAFIVLDIQGLLAA
jgi:ABC-type iron transport system FetAB permease component